MEGEEMNHEEKKFKTLSKTVQPFSTSVGTSRLSHLQLQIKIEQSENE